MNKEILSESLTYFNGKIKFSNPFENIEFKYNTHLDRIMFMAMDTDGETRIEFLDKLDEFEKDIEEDMEALVSDLNEYFENKAKEITDSMNELATKHKLIL